MEIPAITASPTPRETDLWTLSQELETVFLAEMLKQTPLGEARESFGGGIGEDQLSGFLAHEYAVALTRNGGVGLAESIYRALLDAGTSA